VCAFGMGPQPGILIEVAARQGMPPYAMRAQVGFFNLDWVTQG
jgi:hypothetical protein